MLLSPIKSLELAENAYKAGDFKTAYDRAVSVIQETNVMQFERFDRWINPSEAIRHNNEGNWQSGWHASYLGAHPYVTEPMIGLMKSCQIYLQTSIRLQRQDKTAEEIINKIRISFGNIPLEQQVKRVFEQLEFARSNMIFAEGKDPANPYYFKIEKEKAKIKEALQLLKQLAGSNESMPDPESDDSVSTIDPDDSDWESDSELDGLTKQFESSEL